MARIKRSSLTEQATEAIIDFIAEHRLSDGDSLPGTAELAERFEVSVPVIREAIAGLSTIGLVRRSQGRETTVSTPDSTHLSRILGLRIANANVDDDSIQQFREIVEVGNAQLAARNRTDEDIADLDRALDVLRAADSAGHLHSADVAFHAAVGRAAKNDLFTLTLDALEPLLWRLRERVWNGWVAAGGDLDSIVEAHATVLEAIRAGDEQAAAAAMSEHLGQARVGLEYPTSKSPSEATPFDRH